MKRRSFLLGIVLAASQPARQSFAAEPPPSSKGKEWARGRHSSMHMLLEKTIANVDVLTVDVRVGKNVHRRFVELIGSKPYSEALANRLAAAVIDADEALVEVRYLRSVSLKQWMEGVSENLAHAVAAGLVSAELKRDVERRLPVLFAALEKRGYEKGDRLLYHVRPSSLRSVVVSAGGKVLVDQTESGRTPSRVVMASYFAPKNDFREPLLRSLFD